MACEKPKKLGNGLGTSSKSSEMVPKSSELVRKKLVWEKPKRSRQWSRRNPKKAHGRSSERIRNGLTSPKRLSKSPKPEEGGGGGAAGGGEGAPAFFGGTRVHRQFCWGPGCTGNCLGLHVQCSSVAREARTASGSQLLVASPQQDFRVYGLGFRV